MLCDMLLGIGISAEWFEALMLICFGVSWPVSIIKTIRVRRVEGKSLLFLLLVLLGYVAGIIAKLLYASAHHEPVQLVTALYALNGVMVLVDMVLYMKFQKESDVAT